MQLAIIDIGNSKGIRLPKTVLEKYNLSKAVEMTLEDDRIVLTPKRQPREGWAEMAKLMVVNGDAGLLMPDFFKDENWDHL